MTHHKQTLTIAFLSLCLSSALNANPPTAPTPRYHLGVTGRVVPFAGFQVAQVDPYGPAAMLRTPWGPAAVEPRDTIVAINRVPVQSPYGYIQLLNASNGRPVLVSVRDHRTGQILEALAMPQATHAPIRPPQNNLDQFVGNSQDNRTLPPVNSPPHVKVVLIGWTFDQPFGSFVESSLRTMRRILSQVPSIRRQDIFEIRGHSLSANSILTTIQRIPVGPSDTLLVYYAGHGAYHPVAERGDLSGGHYFQIPSGNLMRKDLVAALSAKQARLTVLISDSCNVRMWNDSPAIVKPTSLGPRTNRALEYLLTRHSGVIDINGSTRDSYAWFSPIGGWFTYALEHAIEQVADRPTITWDELLRISSQNCESVFAEGKRLMTSRPAWNPEDRLTLSQISGQATQRPQVFFKRVFPVR